MRRTRKRKKQRKMIILSMICLLCIMTAGYAAFQTNLNISAKGNIVSKGITPSELKNNVVTSGDGLYKDTTEDGRYIYKGTNPNNYITFNNETWRIISIENDNTLKIIKNESISEIPWDEKENRDSATSTYCTNASNLGCNAWAATQNLVNIPSYFTLHNPNGNPNTDSTTYSGTVTQDSSLNIYLNETYYNGLMEEDKGYITTHDFNVGTPGNATDTEDIATDVSQEALYKWNGKIGLMNVTEFLKATISAECTSLSAGYNNGLKSICSNNNWLFKSTTEWTLSPSVFPHRGHVWRIDWIGRITTNDANAAFGVRPVLYLTSNIHLEGSGSEGNPYIIK